jgi:type VII secretion integral membrane protein EccD
MPDSLRHVSIHCGPPSETGHAATIDLSLPAAMTVGELLPWIVDELGIGDGAPQRWQLAHLGGRALDESATVMQNDIRDGDLLVLAGFGEQPRIERSVIATLTGAPSDDGIPTGIRVTGCLWACALGVMALAWAGMGSHGSGRIAAAAVVTVAATAIAVAAPRLGLDSTIAATLNLAAMAQAALLGFLVVPAGPAPANFFLGAVAAGSLGAVLIRVSGCGSEILLAVVTTAGLLAVVTGCATLWPLATTALGATLSALGIGLLPLTPRLSIALAGLTPPVPGVEEDALADNVFNVEARALSGHRNLAGLVLGCSTTAALGIAILAFAGRRQVTAVEVVFAAAVGTALLLRSRSYVSGRCRTGPGICGFFSLTAAFVLVVAWVPQYGSWTGIPAIGAGIAILRPVTVQSPMAARIADALEYGALAAVAPLACWLAGAFDLVRGLGLQ